MLAHQSSSDVSRTSQSMGGFGRQGSAESSGVRQYGRRGQHFRNKREEPTEMGGAAIMKQDSIDNIPRKGGSHTTTTEEEYSK